MVINRVNARNTHRRSAPTARKQGTEMLMYHCNFDDKKREKLHVLGRSGWALKCVFLNMTQGACEGSKRAIVISYKNKKAHFAQQSHQLKTPPRKTDRLRYSLHVI